MSQFRLFLESGAVDAHKIAVDGLPPRSSLDNKSFYILWDVETDSRNLSKVQRKSQLKHKEFENFNDKMVLSQICFGRHPFTFQANKDRCPGKGISETKLLELTMD